MLSPVSARDAHQQARTERRDQRLGSGDHFQLRTGHVGLDEVQALRLLPIPQIVERRHLDCLGVSFFFATDEVRGVEADKAAGIWHNHILMTSRGSDRGAIELHVGKAALAYDALQNLKIRSDWFKRVHHPRWAHEC